MADGGSSDGSRGHIRRPFCPRSWSPATRETRLAGDHDLGQNGRRIWPREPSEEPPSAMGFALGSLFRDQVRVRSAVLLGKVEEEALKVMRRDFGSASGACGMVSTTS